jgi:hypothetical protein
MIGKIVLVLVIAPCEKTRETQRQNLCIYLIIIDYEEKTSSLLFVTIAFAYTYSCMTLLVSMKNNVHILPII